MLNLTKKQRKRLAKEARRLSGRIAEGAAVRLQAVTWCNCGIGHVMSKAGLPVGGQHPAGVTMDRIELAEDLDDLVGGLISEATDATVYEKMRGALAFPLLALADAVEADEARAASTPEPAHV